MEVVKFKEELKERDGIVLNDEFIIFNDYELYSLKTNVAKNFKKFEDLLEIKVGGKTIESMILEKENFEMIDNGGRGSSSGGAKGGLFSGQGSRERGGRGKFMPPAEVNALTSARFKSVEKTAKAYGKHLLDSDREFGAVIDKDGFAVQYVKGGHTSVTHLERQGAYSIHNHPVKGLAKAGIKAYNAPSAPDLKNMALGKGKGTIVASSGNRTIYVIEKTPKFNSKGFVKAMGSAKSTGNYDKDVNNFLRKNQKAYGYKYKTIKF